MVNRFCILVFIMSCFCAQQAMVLCLYKIQHSFLLFSLWHSSYFYILFPSLNFSLSLLSQSTFSPRISDVIYISERQEWCQIPSAVWGSKWITHSINTQFLLHAQPDSQFLFQQCCMFYQQQYFSPAGLVLTPLSELKEPQRMISSLHDHASFLTEFRCQTECRCWSFPSNDIKWRLQTGIKPVFAKSTEGIHHP